MFFAQEIKHSSVDLEIAYEIITLSHESFKGQATSLAHSTG